MTKIVFYRQCAKEFCFRLICQKLQKKQWNERMSVQLGDCLTKLSTPFANRCTCTFNMMWRVTKNDVDSSIVNRHPSKLLLTLGNLKFPVATPVNRQNDNIARLAEQCCKNTAHQRWWAERGAHQLVWPGETLYCSSHHQRVIFVQMFDNQNVVQLTTELHFKFEWRH